MDQIILLEQAIFLFVLIVWIVSEIVSWTFVMVEAIKGKTFDEAIDEIVRERLAYYLSQDEEEEVGSHA